MIRYLWIIIVCTFFFIDPAYPISYYSHGIEQADQIASQAGFHKQRIKTSDFILTAYTKTDISSDILTIYIEGDGFAWVSRRMISSNPTPRYPVALKLATLDPHENIAYLGRPCQYISSEQEKNYHSRYWSDSRFSERVIGSMDQAISVLKAQTGARQIVLAGYSGGAAIAVLVAARREDVSEIKTIAGNLDHASINKYHKVRQMQDSLNPMDYAEKISHISQHHFVGEKDKVVPVDIIKGFARLSGDADYNTIIVVKGVGHSKGWTDIWRELISD
jgi:hypothetical protein